LRFPRYEGLIQWGGKLFALSIIFGFASFPIYVWFYK
jgi:hypothetical protein